MFLLHHSLTIGVELLIGQLRRCKPVSKGLPAIYVGVQGQELLPWQRGIPQQPVHPMSTGAIFLEINTHTHTHAHKNII